MIQLLIAEDDFRVANIHEQFIEKMEGVIVSGKAMTARETLEILKEKEIDLILLDNYMPDETGVDILPFIRTSFPKVDIIMVTAANDRKVVEHSLKFGIVDYLIKPVTFTRFEKAIKKYIARNTFISDNEIYDQVLIDTYLHAESDNSSKRALPKGIDAFTLEKVQELLAFHAEIGCTAEQLGEMMGASRTTARRYLEYLISITGAKAELEYGLVGRPERKYYLKETSL
ncbi:Transcriptional regulatory protein CitT [Bacillus sp. THAF10]|uniref:response regulator n=1 Tax=Bacillus sp. THAF10 TaxID=2587848 RepID=UPI00126859ED|nr:response regulator [Bacillus sp. THAF10]QFT89081.1 Transcriptional regulatory protein CitT [Bacillus sp. THAF10]